MSTRRLLPRKKCDRLGSGRREPIKRGHARHGFAILVAVNLNAACVAVTTAQPPSPPVTVEFDAKSSATYVFKCEGAIATISASKGGAGRPIFEAATFNGVELKLPDPIRMFNERVSYVAHFDGTCVKPENEIDVIISGKANIDYRYLDEFAVYIAFSKTGLELYHTECTAKNSEPDIKAAKNDPACQGVGYNIEE